MRDDDLRGRGKEELQMNFAARPSIYFVFFFSSRRRHTRLQGDWSSDVCSSDLMMIGPAPMIRMLWMSVRLGTLSGRHRRAGGAGCPPPAAAASAGAAASGG